MDISFQVENIFKPKKNDSLKFYSKTYLAYEKKSRLQHK